LRGNVALPFDIYPKEKSMQKRKLPAILAALALAVSAASPAIAAAPNNANIQIGASSTSGVSNIAVTISTASYSVSATIKLAGTAKAPATPPTTTAGEYYAGSAIVVKSPGAHSASIHAMSTTYDAFAKNLLTDTGISSVQGAPQTWQGSTTLGSPNAATKNYPQNSLGSGSGPTGDVVLCFPIRLFVANSTYEDVWYCTETFVWPEAPDNTAPSVVNFGANAPAIQADGVTLRIRFNEGMSAATSPSGFVLKRNGVDVAMTAGNITLGGQSLEFTLGSTVNASDGGTFTLFYTPGTVADDAPTPNALMNFSGASVTNSSTQGSGGGSSSQGSGSGSSSRTALAKYEGPEILAVDALRPVVSGGMLSFSGKNLSVVTSATIGSVAATLSYDSATGLTVVTPAALAPGKYDLVMQSSHGKLTVINAVSIKAPTPTSNIGFRSDAQHLSEKQVLDLVAFNKTLSADYEKVRCIVNAADEKTAKRIADLVCAQVARGEARNVEVIKDIRNTYSGNGFWVRVYAKG
jgi:hypothetical protein